jgi:hypothetical protein
MIVKTIIIVAANQAMNPIIITNSFMVQIYKLFFNNQNCSAALR